MLRVSRYAALAGGIALSLAIVAGPATAQTQYPMAPPPSGYPPIEKTSAEKTAGMLEGSVKKVDPGAGRVQVSTGLFGILGRTLEVTGDTQIQVEGRQATVADIREGAKVKASYEARDGKNVATRIEVVPTQEAEKSSVRRGPSQ